MINLLPPDIKQGYVYGRRNTTLRRYAIGLGLALVGVVVITLGGLFVMQKSINDYENKNQVAKLDLQKDKLDETRTQAKDITNSLKLTVDVLSREILFSKLLTQIATVTPKNTKLTDLSINQVAGAIDIQAKSADINSATQLQVNLQDPNNRIFDKADIQNIVCVPNPTDPKYPCTVTLKALFAKNNPFLFINKGAGKQ